MKNILVAVVITLLIASGAGFYGGMKYAGAGNTPKPQQLSNNGEPRQGRRGSNSGFTAGQVTSKSANSFILQLTDVSTKNIFVDSSTSFVKSASSSIQDIKVGDEVSASGSQNQDGSITATSVRLGGGFGRQFGSQQLEQQTQ
jgi:hypothetical protein